MPRDTTLRKARLVCRTGRDYRGRQGGIKTSTNGVAVYYPFALVALKEFVRSDDYEETGELLLIFEDVEGVQVTLKVHQSTISDLLQRLASPPTAHT